MPTYNRITFYPGATDQNIYARYTSQTTGKIWDGSVMADWLDANVTTYGTAATFLGGGRYGHVLPDLPEGDTYIQSLYKRAGASQAVTDTKLPDEWEFQWNGTTASEAVGPGEAAGEYSDENSLRRFIKGNLDIIGDIDDDNVLDRDALQDAFDQEDAIIDAIIGNEFVMPLANASATDMLLLKRVSNIMVTLHLNETRDLFAATDRNRTTLDTYARTAKEALDAIVNGDWKFDADRLPDSEATPEAGAFSSVPMDFGDADTTSTEFGCA